MTMNLNTMTTREIAELTGKLHHNVLRDTEKMFNELKMEGVTFLTSYIDTKGEARKAYALSTDLTMTLVTRYDTARRYAVVRRLREYEEQSKGKKLTDAEMIHETANLAKKYMEEAHDKTQRLLKAKELAHLLSNYEAGRVFRPHDITVALQDMGLLERRIEQQGCIRCYFDSLTAKGRPLGRIATDTKTQRSLEWRPDVIPMLKAHLQIPDTDGAKSVLTLF